MPSYFTLMRSCSSNQKQDNYDDLFAVSKHNLSLSLHNITTSAAHPGFICRAEWLRFRHTLLHIHTGTVVHDRRYSTKRPHTAGRECLPPQQIKWIYRGVGCVIFAALQLLVVSGFLNLTRVLLGLKQHQMTHDANLLLPLHLGIIFFVSFCLNGQQFTQRPLNLSKLLP